MASKSETSCTKGSDGTEGDTGSGGLFTDDEMPPSCGDSEVDDKTVAFECDRKVLPDGGTVNLLRITACRPLTT